MGSCSRDVVPWKRQEQNNTCKAIPVLLGRRVFLLCGAKMILENKLNFLLAIVHYELSVNQNSLWMEGLPCIWGRAEEKIGSARWTHLSYLGHVSLPPTPLWPFVHGETVNLNACIMQLNPRVKVSWRFSLHAGDDRWNSFFLICLF